MFDDDILKKLNIDNLSNKSDSTIIDPTFALNDKFYFVIFELNSEFE